MATSDNKFIINTIIIIVIVVAGGSLLVWRMNGSARKTDTSRTATSLGAATVEGVQEVTINVESTRYTPSTVSVKLGQKVKLNLVTKNTGGCIRSFTIPSLGINKSLPTTGTTSVEFVPTKKGAIPFACSMGMYTGTINVI
jgi:plastocyanin domain-containing protein